MTEKSSFINSQLIKDISEKKILIKAVFFDLDGTLVSYKTHTIPQSTREALDILRNKGIKLFISTGRHLSTIDNIGGWEPDGYVLLNGGMCIVNGEIIFERHIVNEDILHLLHYLKTNEPFSCVFFLKDKLVMNYMNKNAEQVFDLLNFIRPETDLLENAAKEAVFEIMTINTSEQEKDLMKYLPNSEMTRSHELYGDIVPKYSNKWVGIQKLMQHFELKRDEVIVFGDGNNDIEMIQNAKLGIAMGNGSSNLKAVADMITDTVDENGVWNALKKLNLI